MKNAKKHKTTIIMGDFKAKIGTGPEDDLMGQFGLGARNEGGNQLIQFCREEQFFITNTFYELTPRRLYT